MIYVIVVETYICQSWITVLRSLVPRLHPLQCILAREEAWLLISHERNLISKWINVHGLDICPCWSCTMLHVSSTAVCWFNGLALTVMEAQLNLLCSNTTCRPEECLAKLRQHCKTTLNILTSGQSCLMPFCHTSVGMHGRCCQAYWAAKRLDKPLVPYEATPAHVVELTCVSKLFWCSVQ